LILGYDGTLVPFQFIPVLARPTPQLIEILGDLCATGTQVIVASGRNKETMQSWFEVLPSLGLIAEFGLYYRPPNDHIWQRLPGITPDRTEWKYTILPLLKRYAERTPGVLLEETECSYTWNYRAAGSYGAYQAKDLRSIINSLITAEKLDIDVVDINKALEIRMHGISVGRLLHDVILQANPSMQLAVCIGDLGIVPPKEQGLEVVAPNVELVKCVVGQKPEKKEVNLHLKDSEEVLNLLQKLNSMLHGNTVEAYKGLPSLADLVTETSAPLNS